MATQRYSVTPHPIETLLTWVKSGEIAIPEIQRPFVWEPVKVRNLLDSLYRGYPIGYLTAWRNPTVRLKDGTSSAGKRILIDGQQRVTALMASLLGYSVLTKDYQTVRIRIAFQPVEKRFEVANPAIEKDDRWISDVATLFSADAKLLQLTKSYAATNQNVSEDDLFNTFEQLRQILNNHVGVIELASDLDIETVTEIFIRVNSAGATLSQADFAMSKIAANDAYDGSTLRKAIEYFCHLSVAPEVSATIEANDRAFTTTEYWQKIKWLRDANDDLYGPSYTDMLRVAFTSRFKRGRLQDLVALLSGRNFETKLYEEEIAEQSFATLKAGVLDFVNKTHFDRITMILRSAGFVTNDLIGSQNAVNFSYILYLLGRIGGISAADLERLVRRWYVMSVLRGRYSASPETAFDFDVRQIDTQGLEKYAETVIESEMPDSFWSGMLPQLMDTSSSTSPYFLCYKAAQVKLGDRGFLSRDITVRDLLLNRSDVHHVFPKNYLKVTGLQRGRYNQIANFVVAQSEINIAIGDKPPATYFSDLNAQVKGGSKAFGGITEESDLRRNLSENCVPEGLLDGTLSSYDDFLLARRVAMGGKLKHWFETL